MTVAAERGGGPSPRTAETQLAVVLCVAWNPLGWAPHECVHHAPQVLDVLEKKPTVESVADLLRTLRTEEMGLPPDDPADLRAARIVEDWHRWFVGERSPRQPS